MAIHHAHIQRLLGDAKPIILALVFFFLTGIPSANSQTTDDARKTTEYLVKVNALTARLADLANQSVEYDNLAYAILEEDISVEFAKRHMLVVSTRLRQELTIIENLARQVPPPPSDVEFERFNNSMFYAEKVMQENLGALEMLIENGEEIVFAAIEGDQDVFNRIEVRQLRQLLGTMTQQISTLQMELANQEPNSANFHLYGAMAKYYETNSIFLSTVLEVTENPDVDFFQSFSQMIENSQATIDQGYRHIRNGRNSAKETQQELSQLKAKSEVDVHNKSLILEAYKTFDQSFDVAQKLMELVDGYISDFVEYEFVIPDEKITTFQIEATALEKETNRIMLARQELIQGVK